LNIWKKRYALLIEIYKITATFPKEEKYGLSGQMRFTRAIIFGKGIIL
jgi:four helix bundle protein